MNSGGTLRGALLAAALACTAFVAVQLAWMREPCGTSLDAEIAAGYTLYSCHNAALLPLSVHQGHWSLLARTEGAVFVPYLHHPPLGLWLMEAFHAVDPSITALRAGALLLSAVLLALLWLGLQRTDALRAAVVVALCAGSGALVAHGSGASPPLFGLPFTLAALFAWQRRGPTALYMLCAFCAGIADWNAYGLVPALWWGLSIDRPVRPWRAALLACIPWVAAIVFVLGHMALGAQESGGLQLVIGNVSASLGLQGRSVASLLLALGSECVDLYGWPLLALALLGTILLFVRAASGRMNTSDKLSVQCWVLGLVPCVVFLSRAATHPFWVLVLAPAICMAAALALMRIMDRMPRVAPLLLPVVLVALLSHGQSTAVEVQRARSSPVQEDRARLIEQWVGPNDVLLFSDYSSAFACRALTPRCVVVRMESVAMLARAARALAAGSAPRRIVYAFPVAASGEMQWLLRQHGLVLRDTVRTESWPGAGRMILLQLDAARFFALAG
ncbi:MAG: hypothetical protein EXS14_06135 [Planctomycetes bacterium]|nr:hypothetical protein [Planctomycetota bacterium]